MTVFSTGRFTLTKTTRDHPALNKTAYRAAAGDMGVGWGCVGDEVQRHEMLHHESTQQVIPPILPGKPDLETSPTNPLPWSPAFRRENLSWFS